MDDDRLRNDPFDITGQRLSHYFVVRRIASGGMGMVYEAEDERLQRRVALKVLPPWSRFDDLAIERFRREARAASSLNHPSICTVYEFDEIQGRPFIAMEIVRGPSIKETLAGGPIDADRALRIVSDVAEGLAHAHARSITHRDIKPGNILISEDGRAKITDFGLARISDATTITKSGATIGTVAYMSPEQARGEEAGPESDVWSLGAVYYELLTGEKPFPGEYPSAVVYLIVNEEPAAMQMLRDRFGDRVADVITSCLDKDPGKRPKAAELEVSGRAATMTTPAVPAAGPKRVPATVLLSSVAAILIALAAVFFFNPGSSPPLLKEASIALLPPSHFDLVAEPALNGFVAAASQAVEEIAEDRNLVRYVVPFDLILRDEISSPAEAAGQFGASFVITSRVEEGGAALNLSLVSTEGGRVVSEKSVPFVEDNLHDSFDHAVLATLRMLGLPDSARPQIIGPYAPAEPGAFEIYTRAMVLVEEQQSEQTLRIAIDMLNRAADMSPGFAPIQAGLGKAYLHLYNQTKDPSLLETAERHCDRAIELETDLPDAFITLSRVHLMTGHLGQAKGVLEMAIGPDSASVEALLSLGDLYAFQQKDRKAAEKVYQKAVRLDPGHWDSYRRLGRFYLDQSRFRDAIRQYRHLVSLLPQNAKAYSNLGVAYYYADSLGKAIESWETGLGLAPNDYFLNSNLGAIYFYQGRYGEAAQSYERALATNDADYLIWGNLGTAYLWLGVDRSKYLETKKEAIRRARRALDANPRDFQARAKLAGYRAEIGDTTIAREHLSYFGREPDETLKNETLFEIGAAWDAVGEREIALEWIREALVRGYSTARLMQYPGLDSLRADPTFINMMRTLGGDKTEEQG